MEALALFAFLFILALLLLIFALAWKEAHYECPVCGSRNVQATGLRQRECDCCGTVWDE